MRTSIALCTYNGEKYLHEQLVSILDQTKKVDEIIVCDDCSKDKTRAILLEYKIKYPVLFTIINNESNLGYLRNFEKAISMCSADIIFLADQDDIWEKNKVETLTAYFENNKNKEVVFTNAILFGNDKLTGTKLWDVLQFDKAKQNIINNSPDCIEWLWHNGTVATGATMALRNKQKYLSIKKFKGYKHDGFIALMAAGSGQLGCINDCLIRYRQHPDQALGVRDKLLPVATLNKKTPLDKLKYIFKLQRHYLSELKSEEEFFRSIYLQTNSLFCKRKVQSLQKRISYYNLRVPLIVPYIFGYYKDAGGYRQLVRDIFGKTSIHR